MIEYNKEIKVCKGLVAGYQIFCDMSHPLVNSQGFVYYHRHLASVKLGRWVTKSDHIHHINGDKLDNRLENLDILTNSTHASLHNPPVVFRVITCNNCGKNYEVHRENIKRKFCSMSCYEEYYIKKKQLRCDGLINEFKFSIEKEILEKLVWELPSEKIAKIYNVSGSAIVKRCKLLGISKPPRGYWAKLKTSQKGETKSTC